MNKLKITLSILVVAAIGAGIFFWIKSIKEPEKVKASENQFTRKIKQEIEQLKAKPDNWFCKDFYQEVAYHINDFYKPLPPKFPYGRFGTTQSENDQWKENLESNLYFAYTEKFIKQAKTVFRGSEWRPADLKFIQVEKNELKKSKFLVAGSPLDNDFANIQSTLNKYNEIVSFISSCKGFVYTKAELRDHFPVSDVQGKIARASSLRNNHLENEFANKCSRLHDGLTEIPQYLFGAHVRYLDDKISSRSGMYSYYNSQSEYANIFYKPLKAQVDELDNDIYNVSNFDSEYNRLTKKLDSDSQRAYNYFSNKH
jgi:hypothetical protein